MNIMLGPLVLVITISILPHGHTKAVPKNYLIETDSNEKYGSDYNLGLDEIIKFLSKSVGDLLQKIGSDYDSGKEIVNDILQKIGSDYDSGIKKHGSDYNLGLDEIIKSLSKSVGGLLQKIGSDYDSGKAITKNYPIETDSSEASGKKYGSDSDSGEAATETYLIETDSKESPDNTASSFSRKN